MKKSLIALAVLAASGAAMAQSSVTLYGIVDAYIGQTSATAAAANAPKVKQNVVNSAGYNNSRWGLKGTEDLGNGLKANFILESWFLTDTGASYDNLSFGRTASVGLSGGFGSVSMGRQYTAYELLRAATNNQYDSNFATTATTWANGLANAAVRANDSISYTSPDFGGISGTVVLGLGEDKTDSLSATKSYSAHIKYANGPLLVGYAYSVENTRTTATPAANTDDRTYNLIAGSYDFGVAKLTAGYNQSKQNSVKDKEYQVGVSVPFGAASVSLGYARSNSDISGLNGDKGTGVSLLGTYDLSKRTRMYAGLASTKVEAPIAPAFYKTTTAGVGVRHIF